MSIRADRIDAEEVVVERHFKMKSPLGNISMHASATGLGIWLTPANSNGMKGQIGLFIQNGAANLAIWTKYSKTMPFAISENGLQVVTRSGNVKIIPLEVIADLVVNLAEGVNQQKPVTGENP
jgi:hypothetical protein